MRFFKVKDAKTGDHIASFYLDPYSRPENKRVSRLMTIVGMSHPASQECTHKVGNGKRSLQLIQPACLTCTCACVCFL